MTVVDASVAVKWLLPEAGDVAARSLLSSGERLFGPALIRVEVAAAITRKSRFGEIESRDAETAVDLWLRAIADGVITLVPDEADLPRAVKLALALKHPLQDCLYLALAERLGATLTTADEKFAAKTRPSCESVRLLGGN
ncbi:MAG: type II toxin-antitoxin system VapC family toxin [Bryobacterales bacterium]|nr:type II toxin-antitoxin system VapC family toxin [Bryobacterales bacterium]